MRYERESNNRRPERRKTYGGGFNRPEGGERRDASTNVKESGERRPNYERRPRTTEPREDGERRRALPRRPLPERDTKLTSNDIVCGRNPVREVLRSGRPINKIWVLKDRGDRELQMLASECIKSGAVITEMERQAIDRMAPDLAHQGIVAQVAAHAYADLESILEQAENKGEKPLLLILDELQDGHNLGACLRIADAAGVTAVIIPERRSVGLDSFVAKASAGAIEHVPVCRVTNITTTVLDLKERGFWVFGTAMDTNQTYRDVDYNGKTALIIGNEGDGIGEKLQGHCDFLINIPMHGKVNSLNAAVACGVVVFEAVAQRNKIS